MSHGNTKSQKTRKLDRAKKGSRSTENRIFIPARPNELQIDIDSEVSLRFFRKQWYIFNSRMAAYHKPMTSLTTIYPSSSGKRGHWHVLITFKKPIDPIMRIALQVCLGSDRVRELLSLCRVLNGSPIPTLFFENKAQMKANIGHDENES